MDSNTIYPFIPVCPFVTNNILAILSVKLAYANVKILTLKALWYFYHTILYAIVMPNNYHVPYA